MDLVSSQLLFLSAVEIEGFHTCTFLKLKCQASECHCQHILIIDNYDSTSVFIRSCSNKCVGLN